MNRWAGVIWVGACIASAPWPSAGAMTTGTGVVTVLEDQRGPVNVVVPSRDLGAALDGLDKGGVANAYTTANIKAMRSVGLGPITYRLRTELAVEAWHWNPKGRWSDSAGRQGYWTSDGRLGADIRECHGFRLPRRGSSIDQANNDGYSRIDDGDESTFWKSNPYLDRHFTGEPNAKHPQWVVVDLGKEIPVNLIRIRWGAPFATEYEVEYWAGGNGEGISGTFSDGLWRAFPGGEVTRGKGGSTTLRLCRDAMPVRLIRLWMTASSGIAPKRSRDVRDGLGYAIREVSVGALDGSGVFRDGVTHAHSNAKQSVVYVSSTDPWHRESNLDPRIEQPGFDLVMKSGLANRQPMLVPVGLLYDTPENAAAEIRYLNARHYPVTHVEMGEEPDGQYVTPTDYAALYVQWAAALRKVDRGLVLGGPGFQTDVNGWPAWKDASGDSSWVHQMLAYLSSHGRTKDLGFFSFEWYPFDDVCSATAPQLAVEPSLLAASLRRLWREGLPRSVPVFITEYGYSSYAGRAEVDIEAALLNADIMGQFLALGGQKAYLYGYEPNTLLRESGVCDSWGNLTLFLQDDAHGELAPTAACRGAEMVVKDWLRGSDKTHGIEVASSDIRDSAGRPLVTAYSQKDPNGKRALLLVNKDPRGAWDVKVRLMHVESGDVTPWRKPVEIVQYSREQYVWKARGSSGHAVVNLRPKRGYILRPPGDGYYLPPYSLTVLREK